jgi:hypothetical protein
MNGNKMMALGGGGRFQALQQKVEGEGKSPEAAKAIAASAGMHKYGAGKMNAMAHRAKLKAGKHLGR